MRNELVIDTTTGELLAVNRVNINVNSLVVNNNVVSESNWVGNGTYTFTVGGVTYSVAKVPKNEGNITIVKNNDTSFTLSKLAGSEIVPTKLTFNTTQQPTTVMFRQTYEITIPALPAHGDVYGGTYTLTQYAGYTPAGIIGYVLWGSRSTWCTVPALYINAALTMIAYNVGNTDNTMATGDLTLSVHVLYIKTS